MEKTIKRQVYDAIWEGIVNGEYAADYVFNEKALVEKFQVSKSPIRDALIELCSDGILRSIPRYGYEIVQITGKQLQDIMRLRALIELDNLDVMVGRLAPSQIDQLKQQIQDVDLQLKSGTLNVRQHWENNIGFHRMLYKMGGNQFGANLLERCLKAETMAYSTYCLYGADQMSGQLDTEGHRSIVHCLEQNDRAGALESLKKDLDTLVVR